MNLLNASSFCLMIFIPLAVNNFRLCMGQQEDFLKYAKCIRNFTCGGGPIIGYPFWGNDRPDYCGIPGYHLECDNLSTEIEIVSQKYHVLAIRPADKIMTIARKDFMDDKDACPKEFTTTTLNFTLFNYLPTGFVNLTLSYGCPPIPSNGSQYPNKFSCQTNETSKTDAYYWSQSLFGGVVPDTKACTGNINILIRESSLSSLSRDPTRLSSVLRAGFDVSYDVTATNSIAECTKCEEAEGTCGYNNNSIAPGLACFCPGPKDPSRSDPLCPLFVTGLRKRAKNKYFVGAVATTTGAIMLAIFVILTLKCGSKVYSPKGTSLERLWREEGGKINNQDLEAFFRSCGSLVPIRFRYMDVKKMTNSFDEKLGQGGYGDVFKGKLQDGRLVAVKVLKESKSNDGEEFLNEVASISRTSHINIVALLGFCFEKNKRALIYEFMPNGSLDKLIYRKNLLLQSGLEWETLYQIAVGIARGLEYLHRGCTTRILHFDIKPHNILLNENFCPKIADFGLAKLCPGKESIISMLGTRGTAGYIAPEVFSRNFGGISHKSDVYSYGMMILEMVGGRKNFDQKVGADHSSQLYFPHWAYYRLNLGEGLGLCGVTSDEREEAARKMTIVGLWCIQTNPSSRPSMSKVLEMLEGNVTALEIPPKPFLSSPPRSPPSPMDSSIISTS